MDAQDHHPTEGEDPAVAVVRRLLVRCLTAAEKIEFHTADGRHVVFERVADAQEVE